jgi:hypothetical protein
MVYGTRAFWVDVVSRSVATAAEAALAVAGADGAGWLDAGWAGVGQVAALAAAATVLRCLAKPGDLLGGLPGKPGEA